MSRLPSGRSIALALGAFRTAAGTGLVGAPVASARAIGHDTATATRVTWLTQALGARDLALGLGTLHAASRGRGTSVWLLAGALGDLGDAAALRSALRSGRLKGVAARAIAVGAAGAAAVAVWGAVDQRGH